MISSQKRGYPMQNRAISDAYRIEYAPFEDLFRDQPRLIHWAVNQPLPDAIQDLHHHDALEAVSYTHLDVYKRQPRPLPTRG